MTLIVSITSDVTTTKVTEFLYHNNVPFLRIDVDDFDFDLENVFISNEKQDFGSL